MGRRSALGEQELELMRYVSERGQPVAVRDVAADYGAKHGLAKTTIQTMMERLRAKGYLTRNKRDGLFEYAPAVSQKDLLRDLVRDFVDRALGGASSPLVAYLAERRGLTREELALLEQSVDELAQDNPTEMEADQ